MWLGLLRQATWRPPPGTMHGPCRAKLGGFIGLQFFCGLIYEGLLNGKVIEENPAKHLWDV